ncbi:MAG: hypothetical protein L0Y56_01400 [Nitrospira sp.]|nr:hypothetical protein [Nitrospira sp.]
MEIQVDIRGAWPWGPAWSPDGEWIAFSGPFDDPMYLVRPDGSEMRSLPGTEGKMGDPTWSPDGYKIAYFQIIDFFQVDMLLFDLKTGGIEKLTAYEPAWNSPDDWSPNGRYLLFNSNFGLALFDGRTYVMDLKHGVWWPLVDNPRFSTRKLEDSAVWSPDGRWIAEDIDGKTCILTAKGELYKCVSDNYEFHLYDWGQ